MPSTGVVVKVPPLHITAVRFEIVAFGLTVTVTVNGVPVQLPDVGVTVYVAVCRTLEVFVRVPFILPPALPAPPVRLPEIRGAGQV